MESSEIQKRIINLGKALVEELDTGSGVDTLARWMAHYIAEKMTIAENAVGDDKMRAEHKCFETILKLWQHRSSLPDGQRPFESFEPIFRVLKGLDPGNEQPYYISDLLIEDEKIKVTDSVQKWLDVALDIDEVARIWLDYVFKQAALCAKDEKTLKWLENSIDLQDNDDSAIITYLISDDFLPKVSDERKKDSKKQLIKDRIKKLEEFSEFNQKLLAVLKEELGNIPGDEVSKDKDDQNKNYNSK
jgi:hypothetical protein